MIGLLGGAFNPPHHGHLELARRALDEFDLERLDVLVSGDPAHKDVDCPVDVRVELAKLAFAGLPRTNVQADPYRYTIDRLRAEPPPDDAIFLMGADQYRDFPTWKEPDAVLEHVQLGVATRAGVDRPPLASWSRGPRPLLRDRLASDRVERPPRPRAARGVARRARSGRGRGRDRAPWAVPRAGATLTAPFYEET